MMKCMFLLRITLKTHLCSDNLAFTNFAWSTWQRSGLAVKVQSQLIPIGITGHRTWLWKWRTNNSYLIHGLRYCSWRQQCTMKPCVDNTLFQDKCFSRATLFVIRVQGWLKIETGTIFYFCFRLHYSWYRYTMRFPFLHVSAWQGHLQVHQVSQSPISFPATLPALASVYTLGCIG
jgi:hypothetical protein